MSYDIFLVCAHCKMCDEHANPRAFALEMPYVFSEGGTQAMGGSNQCWLNVTYNYGPLFYEIVGEQGIRTLYGLTGKDATPILTEALAALGNERPSDDYWAATKGNARKALERLLSFAKQHPEGVFTGD